MSAEAEIRSIVDRILRLKEEQDALSDDIKEIYAEAKGNGYDKTALGALVSELRKRAKNPDKADEADALLDLYRQAYHGVSHTHAPAHTREALPAHDAETGVRAGQVAA